MFCCVNISILDSILRFILSHVGSHMAEKENDANGGRPNAYVSSNTVSIGHELPLILERKLSMKL